MGSLIGISQPEGMYTNEMYIGGMSSSLPEDVQEEMYHSVPGLEHAKIVKNAYAIEYDCINPRQLYPTLEFKKIKGLFLSAKRTTLSSIDGNNVDQFPRSYQNTTGNDPDWHG